ncbi:hypothetical protein Bca4012_056401 [Brassica carinata]
MVMTENVFKLDLPESYMDKEMTRSQDAVQRILPHRKSIKKKKKKASVNRHDSEADNDGGKKLKTKRKHKRVSGGHKILNTESSKVSEGSRRHEKSLLLHNKRTGKALKRGYLLYEAKTDEDKGEETGKETSDTEEEIGVVKVCEWIDSLAKLWNHDPEYLDTGQNDEVNKENKKQSSKKVKLSMEDVKIDNHNAVSKFRITDPLWEKLQATTFDMVLGGADLVGRAHTGQVKTMFLMLSILKSLINGPAKRKKKNVYGSHEIKLKRGVGTPGRIKDHTERHNIATTFLKQDKKTIDLVGNDEIKTSNSVTHIALPCNKQAISRLIPYIDRWYSSGGSKICFTKTKDQASEFSGLLSGARTLDGDIQQSQHKITLTGFRKGKFSMLVATNVTARGLDINNVQLIIQCESPRDVEDYISCSGRIGGSGNTGVVVMLYGSRNSGVSRIEKQAGKRFEHVSALHPNDIVKAVGMEASEKTTQVCDSVVPAFMMAAGRRKLSESAPLDEEHGGNNAGGGKKSNKVTKRNGARTTKKKVIAKDEPIEESSQFLVDSDDVSDNESDTKEPLRTRKKASPAAGFSDVEEGKTEKKVKQRTVKKDKDLEDGLVTTSCTYDEVSDAAQEALAVEATDADSEGEEINLRHHESEDISHMYGWPPLVCCLGSAQHVFVKSGRPANRFLDCEFKTVEARLEAFHRKEEELKKELKIVKNQHASDSAVLLLVTRELEKVSLELAAANNAKNLPLNQAENTSKMIFIHAEKVDILSSELIWLKVILDSTQEKQTISNEEIAVLKSELEKARSCEAEVKERDKIIKKLDAEIEVLKLAKSYAYGFSDQWCNKAIELEEQLEEANMMKKSASNSLVSLIKQLEGSNTGLQVMESEVTDLKDKAKLMATVGIKQRQVLEKSEHLLETAEELLSKVEKEEINLKTELEIFKDEKSKTLSELERSKEEEEKSETAIQSLALELHQTSSERMLKRRLLSIGGQDYETHVEDRKLVIKSTNEKYEKILHEVEQTKKPFESLTVAEVTVKSLGE